jgi:hypothetical protein
VVPPQAEPFHRGVVEVSQGGKFAHGVIEVEVRL